MKISCMHVRKQMICKTRYRYSQRSHERLYLSIALAKLHRSMLLVAVIVVAKTRPGLRRDWFCEDCRSGGSSIALSEHV